MSDVPFALGLLEGFLLASVLYSVIWIVVVARARRRDEEDGK